jgi:hypothetical protein
VPQVRQSVPGPKKMGEAQRSLLLYWPQTSLSILKWIALLRVRLVKTSAANEIVGTPGRQSVMQRKAFVGLRPSFSSHLRFGERGAPVDFLRCLL